MLIGPMHCSELHHCLGWDATGGDRHFTHPLKTCSLLVHAPGKNAALSENVSFEVKQRKKRLSGGDDPFRLLQMHFNNIKASLRVAAG